MNKKESYPIIIYSDEIKRIFDIPKEPEKTEFKDSIYLVLIISLVLLINFVYGAIETFEFSSIFGGLIFSFLSLICLLFFIFSLSTIIYNSSMYYKIRHKKWEKTIRKLEIDKSERITRRAHVQHALANRKCVKCDTTNENENIKRGISDKWFYNRLKKEIEDLGGSISMNKKIMIFKNNYVGYRYKSLKYHFEDTQYYYPDIAIFINKLCLDIEIDEPYTLDSGEPIHCIGSDNYRNNYIASQGWEIIRFSEQQIVEYPDECIKTIKNLIEFILDGNIQNVIPDLNDNWIMDCWNDYSAKIMAKECYRESYLFNSDGSLKVH